MLPQLHASQVVSSMAQMTDHIKHEVTPLSLKRKLTITLILSLHPALARSWMRLRVLMEPPICVELATAICHNASLRCDHGTESTA
jgi:hypothetical protein